MLLNGVLQWFYVANIVVIIVEYGFFTSFLIGNNFKKI